MWASVQVFGETYTRIHVTTYVYVRIHMHMYMFSVHTVCLHCVDSACCGCTRVVATYLLRSGSRWIRQGLNAYIVYIHTYVLCFNV